MPFRSGIIQRGGRMGRDAPGSVVILTTNRSLDERYLWSGLKRERRMKRLVKKLAAAGEERLKAPPPPPPQPETPGGRRPSTVSTTCSAPLF